ncbi:hypothetical protein CsatB_016514 [Cannabis sativa]
MVKIHPQSNGPNLPPPPPPQRNNFCCFLFQLCFFLVAASFSLLLIIVVVLSILFGTRREVVVSVTNVSLTDFDLKPITNTNTTTFSLSYDMSFNINFTNPNARIAIYYDAVRACAYYATTPFAVVNLASFYQGHKTTKALRVVFKGNKTVSFDDWDGVFLSSCYDEEKSGGGVYSVTVVLNVSVRTKYGKMKYGENHNYIYCYLRVPLSSTEETKFFYPSFQVTPCAVVHIIT